MEPTFHVDKENNCLMWKPVKRLHRRLQFRIKQEIKMKLLSCRSSTAAQLQTKPSSIDVWMVFLFTAASLPPRLRLSAASTTEVYVLSRTWKHFLLGFCFFTASKTKKVPPFVSSSGPGLESVKAESCLGCRGPSQRSWCPSQSHRHGDRPPPGFVPVFAGGWRRGEPADPGNRNDRASPRTGPGERRWRGHDNRLR